MAQQYGGEKHTGVLIRGANGQLYFFRDDDKEPQPVRPDFEHTLRSKLPDPADLVTFPVPDEVQEALSREYDTPFWCIVFVSAHRLPT